MSSHSKLVLISVSFAFIVWGAWTLYANWGRADSDLVFRSALFQALYSGGMTLYMSFSVLFLARRTHAWKAPWLWPVLGTVGPSSVALICMHLLIGTPAFWKTISMPILVSTGYCVFLTRKARMSSANSTER